MNMSRAALAGLIVATGLSSCGKSQQAAAQH
ncbi:energy transducer TonB, partial [Xanthomonas vasicola pv. vasculorum NCPPB 895]